MSNYGFVADGLSGGIFPTDDPADGEEVFDTFAGARKALADWFDYVAAAYRQRAREARKLRAADMRPGGPHSLAYPSAT